MFDHALNYFVDKKFACVLVNHVFTIACLHFRVVYVHHVMYKLKVVCENYKIVSLLRMQMIFMLSLGS